jgi:hypothetical protein
MVDKKLKFVLSNGIKIILSIFLINIGAFLFEKGMGNDLKKNENPIDLIESFQKEVPFCSEMGVCIISIKKTGPKSLNVQYKDKTLSSGICIKSEQFLALVIEIYLSSGWSVFFKNDWELNVEFLDSSNRVFTKILFEKVNKEWQFSPSDIDKKRLCKGQYELPIPMLLKDILK